MIRIGLGGDDRYSLQGPHVMKSDRRHELEQNELAESLTQGYAIFNQYRSQLLAAILICVIIGTGVIIYRQFSYNRDATASLEFFQAQRNFEAARLAQVGANFPRSAIGAAALVQAGEIMTAQGCDTIFRNKTLGRSQLAQGADYLLQSIDIVGDPVLNARATFALGQAREGLNEIPIARGLYERVYTQWPESVFAEPARQRAAALDRYESKLFYDQFAKFDPAPMPTPDTLTPGGKLPFDIKNLPGEAPEAKGAGTAATSGTATPAESATGTTGSASGAASATSGTTATDTAAPTGVTSAPSASGTAPAEGKSAESSAGAAASGSSTPSSDAAPGESSAGTVPATKN